MGVVGKIDRLGARKKSRLLRAGVEVESVFAINGINENVLSAAFAFSLHASLEFLDAVTSDLIPGFRAETPAEIRIQNARRSEGITDVEIRVPGSAYFIFEAKAHSIRPSDSQLRTYSKRCLASGLQACMVSLVNGPYLMAHLQRESTEMNGVPVHFRTWRWARQLAVQARAREKTPRARLVLQEFSELVEGIVARDPIYSNETFVVSLGPGKPMGWEISWIEIVEKYSRYFYPFQAKGWPVPPNYMGFRYGGRLQCVRHVTSYEIVDDVRVKFRGASKGDDWGPHYLLTLGPAIRPTHEVGLGPRVQQSARVWCMIDTLLTCPTISDALTETERRRRENEGC